MAHVCCSQLKSSVSPVNMDIEMTETALMIVVVDDGQEGRLTEEMKHWKLIK